MTELLTAAQMRAIETAAIESGEVTGLQLMERAGRGVVDAVFEEWPELAQAPHRAVVLCGPGNNGGDGFVVARMLKEWGWEVEVFIYGDPEKLPPDAKVSYERWREVGEILNWDVAKINECQGTLFFDAVFGTGLVRPLASDLSEPLLLLSIRDGHESKIVAVDAPSGLCLDSGHRLESRLGGTFADLTISFHAEKVGHRLALSQQHCGKVVVKDIGLDSGYDEVHVHLIDYEWLGVDLLPDLSKWRFDHKYAHGHALILSGGPGKGGAGRLAARGALRIGAGLVTLGCPPAALQENAAQLNAIMLNALGSDEDLSLLLDGDTRINALCLGPGLGTGARERQLVAAALAANLATVLDADALTLSASEGSLIAALHDRCVLTPHAGEFARLFPDIAMKLNAPAEKGPAYSKVDATREAAARAGCTVLFKGPDTVIASPDGRCAINSAHYDRAAPWLATAGSGDVLAGFIAGLLARGFATQAAAETAAWLHVECALKFGPGLIAEDLPEELPQVYRDLRL